MRVSCGSGRDQRDAEERPGVVAVAVDAVVDGARRRLEPEAARVRQQNASRRRTVREKKTKPAASVATTKSTSIQRYGPIG